MRAEKTRIGIEPYALFTFGFVKPHAFSYRYDIVNDVEKLGSSAGKHLFVVHQKEDMYERSVVEKHYEVHRKKPFFSTLIDSIADKPVYEFIVSGIDAINAFREILGATDSRLAKPGTIRHKYGMKSDDVMFNAVHASDSWDTFVEEASLHFKRGELEPGLDQIFWDAVDTYRTYLNSLKKSSRSPTLPFY